MRTNPLGTTGLTCSALGFGCVRLASQPRSEAMAVLGVALDCGITHFDVARLYGRGHAESVLGQFIRDKRDRVTIATKFGLNPPAGMQSILRAVGKVIGPVRKFDRQRSDYSPAAAERSLETSLKKLGTDYVDILFLHDCTLADAAAVELLGWLERQIVRGTIRCAGLATPFGQIPADISRIPPLYQIIQFDDNAHKRNAARWANVLGQGLIAHGVYDPVRPLAEKSATKAAATRLASADLNADLSNSATVRAFLLQYSLEANSQGVVLLSSTSPEHVQANARVAEDPVDAARLHRFIQWVDEMLKNS